MSDVGSDDVRTAAGFSRAILDGLSDRDWSVPARPLQWECRTTAAHIADALAFYAAHLGARTTDWLKFDVVPHADASNRHLARLIEAMGNVLAYVVEATPGDVRAYHHSGMWRREVFASFGCLEALVHTGDIAAGLEAPCQPPDDLCRRVVTTLFAGAPQSQDPWLVMLWATGRGELQGAPPVGPDWLLYWVNRAMKS